MTDVDKAAVQAAAEAPMTAVERFVLANDWMPMQVAINVMRLYPLHPEFYESGEFKRLADQHALQYAVLKKRELDSQIGTLAVLHATGGGFGSVADIAAAMKKVQEEQKRVYTTPKAEA